MDWTEFVGTVQADTDMSLVEVIYGPSFHVSFLCGLAAGCFDDPKRARYTYHFHCKIFLFLT